jgi:hypothetical protein
MAALEITSRNILCGSVRMVYAIIYTLFLVRDISYLHDTLLNHYRQGFGLTLGSDLFLAINARARHEYQSTGRVIIPKNLTRHHGHFTPLNGTQPFVQISASLGFLSSSNFQTEHIVKGMSCGSVLPAFNPLS